MKKKIINKKHTHARASYFIYTIAQAVVVLYIVNSKINLGVYEIGLVWRDPDDKN